MKSYLGSYICGERLKKKLNTAELVGMIGYRNINKGMRRISALEREGCATADLLKKVVDTLKLDACYVDSLIRIDCEAYEAEYERWLNEPVQMTYTIRTIPAIYLSYDLPSEITSEKEAIAYVAAIPRIISAWFGWTCRGGKDCFLIGLEMLRERERRFIL